jgi:hypothetical protein
LRALPHPWRCHAAHGFGAGADEGSAEATMANQGTPNTTQSLTSCRNTGVMLWPSVVQSK